MIYKFKENRVWRAYTGGKRIDRFCGKGDGVDSRMPEEWLASTVEAFNPDRPMPGEGLSVCEDGRVFRDVLAEDPEKILGEERCKRFDGNLSILVKLLDSAERLVIQCHPTVPFAKEYFGSDFGKTECWFFLDTEPDACVYLGFKEGITRERWQALFDKQDREGMLSCLHKFPVSPGELWFVDGGVPHAIGAGCFMIEFQEPSDLMVIPERVNAKGKPLAESKLHGGLGFDKMFDCFVYEGLDEETVKERYYRKAVFAENCFNAVVDSELTEKFAMKTLRVNGAFSTDLKDTYAVCVVTDGVCSLQCGTQELVLKKGQSFLVGAGSDTLRFSGRADMVFCIA